MLLPNKRGNVNTFISIASPERLFWKNWSSYHLYIYIQRIYLAYDSLPSQDTGYRKQANSLGIYQLSWLNQCSLWKGTYISPPHPTPIVTACQSHRSQTSIKNPTEMGRCILPLLCLLQGPLLETSGMNFANSCVGLSAPFRQCK